MKSFLKNGLHIIIPTLCLILCVAIALPLGIYRVEGREIGYDYSVSVSPSAVYADSYDVSGGVYTPEDANAHLVLPLPSDKEINDVRIVFKRPIKSDCTVKLLYGSENVALSDENAIEKVLKKGSVEYFCELENDAYTIIECYIPTSFEIDSVILSHVVSSKPVYETVVNKPLLMWTLIPAVSLYAISLCALIIIKRKRAKK